ncbi:MAG: rhodanese-like domain-containing protein [Spirosomataceae bacterium]|jgi:rhodanese-related sulfurtransferase
MKLNFDITVEQLREMLESGENINLLDVRNPSEYADDNLGGILIPLGELPDNLEEIEHLKGEHIYIHCRSGARSAQAKEILISEGYTNVHNVLGGIVAYRELEE